MPCCWGFLADRTRCSDYPTNTSTDMSQDIDQTLNERGARYGTFADHAAVSQSLKSLVEFHLEQRKKKLAPDQREAIEMICHKLARIINGDPDYADSWVDIAGYAKLVADRLEGAER